MLKHKIPIITTVIALIILLLFTHTDNLYLADVQQWTDYSSLTEQDDGSYIFTVEVTDPLPDEPALAIRSGQQEFTASVNGEVIYSYERSESQPWGQMPPSRWHFFEVPENTPITLQYSSAFHVVQAPLSVYTGTLPDLLLYITQMSQPALVLSLISLCAGIFLMMTHVIWGQRHSKQLLHFACFLILFAVWSWGESKTYYHNYTNLFWQSQITFLSVMLLPYPITLSNQPYCRGLLRKINDGYAKVVLVSAAVGMVLQALNLVELIDYLIITQCLLLLGSVLVSIIRINGVLHAKTRHEILIGVGFLALIVSVVIETTSFLAGNFLTSGVFARVGVFFFAITIAHYEIIIQRGQQAQALALQIELEKANTHLMANQMKPHFIHNTLLAIQESCYHDPRQAYESIGMFSRYIRASLEGLGDCQLIPFQTELEHVRLYVHIQQLCYEDAIRYEEDITAFNFDIPPFSIQPIVENAIVHGIRKRRGTGTVSLSVKQEGNEIVITIADNGVGYSPSFSTTNSFSSSKAVIYRIEKLLGGTISATSKPGEGTTVTIHLPAKRRKESLPL